MDKDIDRARHRRPDTGGRGILARLAGWIGAGLLWVFTGPEPVRRGTSPKPQSAQARRAPAPTRVVSPPEPASERSPEPVRRDPLDAELAALVRQWATRHGSPPAPAPAMKPAYRGRHRRLDQAPGPERFVPRQRFSPESPGPLVRPYLRLLDHV